MLYEVITPAHRWRSSSVRDPRGQLGENAGWLAADAAETGEDYETVLRVLQAMVADPHQLLNS